MVNAILKSCGSEAEFGLIGEQRKDRNNRQSSDKVSGMDSRERTKDKGQPRDVCLVS